MATKKESKQVVRKQPIKSVDQQTIARIIATKYGYAISEVMAIVEEEQRLTMTYVKQGFKVIKKNYITLESKPTKAKKWLSPLNGKVYELPEHQRINVRIGDGFKAYVSGLKPMPEKICRFVNEI